jgi:hypothetical protein
MSQSYGIKVSKDNKDVRRSFIDDMSFTSGENSLRVVNKGSVVVHFNANETDSDIATVQFGIMDGKNYYPNYGESFPTSTLMVIAFADFGDGPYAVPFIGSFLTKYIGGYFGFWPMAAPFGGNMSFSAKRTTNTADQWGGTYPNPYDVTFRYYLLVASAKEAWV